MIMDDCCFRWYKNIINQESDGIIQYQLVQELYITVYKVNNATRKM